MTKTLLALASQGVQSIRGTGGMFDYILVARDPKTGAKLGIKAMIDLASYKGTGYATLTLRTRNAAPTLTPAMTAENVPVEPVPEAPSEWSASFPGIVWKNANDKRRSVQFQVAIPVGGPTEAPGINHYIRTSGVVDEIWETILGKVPRTQFLITRTQFADFLCGTFDEAFEGMTPETHVAQLEEKVAAAKEKADKAVAAHAALVEQLDVAKVALAGGGEPPALTGLKTQVVYGSDFYEAIKAAGAELPEDASDDDDDPQNEDDD